MKKLAIALLGMIALLCISCNNDDSSIDVPLRPNGDSIVISQKNISFNSESNVITITTTGEGWWLAGLSLDKVGADLSKVDALAKKFIVNNEEYQVERKDSKTIVIAMNKNTTNKERVLSITLEDGDYFDGITVTQAK